MGSATCNCFPGNGFRRSCKCMKQKRRKVNATDGQVGEAKKARLHSESAALPIELLRPSTTYSQKRFPSVSHHQENRQVRWGVLFCILALVPNFAQARPEPAEPVDERSWAARYRTDPWRRTGFADRIVGQLIPTLEGSLFNF